MSKAEDDLAWRLDLIGIPYEREHIFRGIKEDRRWRFDFLLLPSDLKIAVEVEGGVFSNGRHVRGKGYTADLVKYNEALMEGISVLRFTPAQVNGIAMEMIPQLYKTKAEALGISVGDLR